MEGSTAVFVSKEIMVDKLKINIIYHFSDGYFQFMNGVENNTDDLIVVSIDNILAIDSNLENVILSLPEGQYAIIDEINKNWIYEELNE